MRGLFHLLIVVLILVMPAVAQAATFNQVTFKVTTGSDDLRGDSSATAVLHFSGGGSQTFVLKSQSESGWANNSVHSKAFGLKSAKQLDAFKKIAITLTSHNGAFETDDNWNVQKLNITVSNSGASRTCLLQRAGNPLVRLTGSSPSASYKARAGCKQTGSSASSIGSPSVGNIDQDMFAVMKASDVHGASLAILDGTRLVYAKGYSWGPAGTPAVSPTTLFRQASVSKLITALSTMQLISEGKLTLQTTMQSVLNLKTHSGRAPTDKRFANITIQDLLEMRSGLDSTTEVKDVTIASALGKSLPIDAADIQTYAAGETLISAPGDRSQAFYNDSNFDFLAYVVAKLRNAASFIEAIQAPLLKPLGITRIRSAQALRSAQLPNEATYYPNPYQTAKSVMTPAQPTVELGYGDKNLPNMQGGGGLSAAATDMARVLAAMQLKEDNPVFKPGMVDRMLKLSYAADNDKRFTHSNAFGYYGLDSVGPVKSGGSVPPYQADKGGYLETSQNAIFYQDGGISYVVCWNGHTTGGESWYPVFNSVLKAAVAHNWGNIDLFPKYGMPAFHTSAHAVPHFPVPLPPPIPMERLDPRYNHG